MITEILNMLIESKKIELIETNELDDGTIEKVYESQVEDRITLIRTYELIED